MHVEIAKILLEKAKFLINQERFEEAEFEIKFLEYYISEIEQSVLISDITKVIVKSIGRFGLK